MELRKAQIDKPVLFIALPREYLCVGKIVLVACKQRKGFPSHGVQVRPILRIDPLVPCQSDDGAGKKSDPTSLISRPAC